jgi:glycosyltransferase involved in cell wall biosynthesis
LNTLSIILLTHNRPYQAYEAIQSILAQSDSRFRLIVSDNSSDDQLKKLIQDDLIAIPSSKFRYLKRPQVYNVVDHGNLCLSEVDADYFCLFHDDDLMLPNFVANFWSALRDQPNLASCGMNAFIEKKGEVNKLFFQHYRRYIGPISPKGLVEKYFARHQLGIAPYPSYIYKKSAMNGMCFKANDGKYGDVIWLLEMATRGEMVWVSSPSMIYRLHDGNDSLSESRKDRLKFLAYLKKNKKNLGLKILTDYRFFLYKKNLPELLLLKQYNLRTKLLTSYVQNYRITRWLRLDQHLQLVRKFLIRQLIKLNKLIDFS